MTCEVDIVIAGAGPAGASTALHLSHHAPELSGRILVLDRATFPRDKICAGAIGARADKLLARIGVKVLVPSAEVCGLEAVTLGGRQRRRAPYSIGRVVRRREFDAALAAQLPTRGIQCWFGTALRGFQLQGGKVVVTTDRGEVRANALVGADGVGSVVRRGLGLPRRQLYAQAVEVDTPWQPNDAPSDVLSFDLLDRDEPGYAWDFPTLVDGRSMVCRGLYRLTRGAPASRAAANADSRPIDLAQLLRRRLRRQGIDPTGLLLRRFAERGLPLHAAVGGERVLLVGDAAGIDPVLGEGIAQAIFYGEAAARYLLGARQRGDYRFGDYRAFLARQRIGVDLRLRAAALPLIYGAPRRWMERWITRSASLTDAGMAYFAGQRVPRRQITAAVSDLLASSMSALRFPTP